MVRKPVKQYILFGDNLFCFEFLDKKERSQLVKISVKIALI